jgi:hypothetical protein
MMKPAAKSAYPPGWNEKKVLGVIAHYDRQTDEEGALEIASSPEASGETWMCVPVELVETIVRLVEDHEQKAESARSRNPIKKVRKSSARNSELL